MKTLPPERENNRNLSSDDARRAVRRDADRLGLVLDDVPYVTAVPEDLWIADPEDTRLRAKRRARTPVD